MILFFIKRVMQGGSSLLWVLAFVAANACTGQSAFNRSFPYKVYETGKYVIEKNGELYLPGSVIFGSGAVIRLGSDGQVMPFPLNTTTDLIMGGEIAGDNLVFFGHDDGACGFSNFTVNVVVITNTTASAVLTVTFSAPTGSISAWVQLADSSIACFANHRMVRIHPNGAIVGSDSIGLTDLSSAILLPGGNILVSGLLSGIPHLAEYTPAASAVSLTPQPARYMKLVSHGGGFLGNGDDGKLYKLSAGQVATTSSLLNGVMINDFALFNDTIFAITSPGSNSSGYAIADTSFNVVFSSVNATQHVDQSAIRITSSGKAAILYTARASNDVPQISWSGHTCLGVQVKDRYKGNQFDRDLRLQSAVVHDTREIHPPNIVFRMKIRATVKNVGNREVNQFYLNCYEAPHVHCGENSYHECFVARLAPGDSVTVITSEIRRAVYGVSVTANQVIARYCLYLTLPDSTTDANFADNEICEDFSGLITTLTDFPRDNAAVYPNPSSDRFNVTLAANTPLLLVTDITGREVYRFSNPPQEFELDATSWSPGVYFLLLKSDNGTQTFRIIRE